jgi:hypothetical protein
MYLAFFHLFGDIFLATHRYHLFVQQLGVIFWELKKVLLEFKINLERLFWTFGAFGGDSFQWQSLDPRQAIILHYLLRPINQDLPRFRLWRLNYAIVSFHL